jgi:hypothetical protein
MLQVALITHMSQGESFRFGRFSVYSDCCGA